MNLTETFAAACRMAAPLDVRAVHRVSGSVQTYSLRHPFAFIGRAQPMGVRLDDPSVSQCHAYLQVVDGVPYCADLGSRTGVVWDDGAQGRGWVHPGHTVRIGMFDVRIGGSADDSGSHPSPDDSLDGDPGRGDPRQAPSLEVHAPGAPGGAVHPLEWPVTLVGRHPNCHVRFLDEAVAYFQCALVDTHDGVWCVDILSRKGTRVNGRATRLTRLRDGDVVELGPIALLLRSGPASRHPLVVSAAPAAPAADVVAAIPRTVAESVATAFTPFREVMEQFQQCFVTMSRMFMTMQQEQTSMMCEQMRQIQELLKELREMRADGPRGGADRNGSGNGNGMVTLTPSGEHPAAPAPPPAPGPKLPTPKVSDPAEAKALADAHAWFLDRLAKMGQSPGTPK